MLEKTFDPPINVVCSRVYIILYGSRFFDFKSLFAVNEKVCAKLINDQKIHRLCGENG